MSSFVLNDYLSLWGEIPSWLKKYLTLPSLLRLKDIGYFCGMDYASIDVYDFNIYVSRFDHSLSVALMTWNFSNNFASTLAALFHDIATPCFSHAIDYMNGDFETQESTEEKTREMLLNDKVLIEYLNADNLNIEDIIDFKSYSIVDNDRPKLCSDRLDGIILTSLVWTKSLTIAEAREIVLDTSVYYNEEQKLEIGFKHKNIAQKIIKLNDQINAFCHSNFDTYMMLLLAKMTKYCLNKNLFTYNDLFIMNESEILDIMQKEAQIDKNLENMYNDFTTIKIGDIPTIKQPKIKNRIINPLVGGKRLC